MAGHLFAIVNTPDTDQEVRRIQVARSTQQELDAKFDQHAKAIVEGVTPITYNPRDGLEADEIFTIRNFDLPPQIARSAQFPQEFSNINVASEPGIRSIYYARQSESGKPNEFLFQSFSPGRQALGKRFALLEAAGVFTKIESAGIILTEHLDAAHIGGHLLFKSFSNVNRFLDLSDYFVAATDKDIRDILGNKVFTAPNKQAVIDEADSVIRKKMMILKSEGTLQGVTPSQIHRVAKKNGVALVLKQGKIVFPETRGETKQLLNVLLDAYYQGELTGRRFLATRQRPLS